MLDGTERANEHWRDVTAPLVFQLVRDRRDLIAEILSGALVALILRPGGGSPDYRPVIANRPGVSHIGRNGPPNARR